MKRILVSLACLTGLFSLCQSQIVLKEPLSPSQTGYSIDARLDVKAKAVHAKMQAFWVNMSPDNVGNIQLHMYLNAFRNNKSTFNSEGGGMMTGFAGDSGFVEINTISDNKGNDLFTAMHFISPDDGNKNDKTVLEITLPETCKPGDTVRLIIDFTSKLPKSAARTGYSDNFYFVAQWFPKFGVYEPSGMRYATKGTWNCHQFHRNSEFYSNHSLYEMKLNVPKEYVVGSGGLLMDESSDSDSTKILHYRAEDIVDFAWTAWPAYGVHKDKWNNVDITFLYPPDRINQVDRQITAIKHALEYLEEHVGPYPWPHVTFVDPPTKGSFCGGMEYTTIFTSMSFAGIPEFMHLPEMVTVHEFGHAYFMGILASNEFEEPWLDEGVNTYWEGRILDHYYGAESGILDHELLRISDRSVARMSYVNAPGRQSATNAEHSWNYPAGTYSMMSYHKAGVILQALEGIIGQEKIDEIFREYYRKWAFRHPSAKDFIAVANEVVAGSNNNYGPDLNWFFNQTLYGTEICDYKVLEFRSHRITESDSLFSSSVTLQRDGGLMLPVEVLIHFKNGEEAREKWDGISRTKEYNYVRAGEVDWVKIDPDYKNVMDINYINNSKTTDPYRVPVRRMRNKTIVFLQFFMSLISL
jgi:hypothetical protein